MTAWEEVADGVFRRRYQPHDVSVCAVRGSDGLLIADTRSSHRQADEIRADLRELGTMPVRWVVNTHAHFDHTFGNARFGPASDAGAPIYAHERVPAHLDAYERPMLAELIAAGEEPAGEWREIVITPPTVLVGDAMTLDLGGTTAELLHLGRGHTDNDLLVHLPASGVWLTGDLVEESGPPVYGSGSFPLDSGSTTIGLASGRRCARGTSWCPGTGRWSTPRSWPRSTSSWPPRPRSSWNCTRPACPPAIRRPRPATAGRSRRACPARAWPLRREMATRSWLARPPGRGPLPLLPGRG